MTHPAGSWYVRPPKTETAQKFHVFRVQWHKKSLLPIYHQLRIHEKQTKLKRILSQISMQEQKKAHFFAGLKVILCSLNGKITAVEKAFSCNG